MRRLAADLAASLGADARVATTVGVERATLRLLGVGGLDHAGRPLAASVVDRAIANDPVRLARGVLLPFVAAVMLYEAPPLDIATDVASGAIDLDLEAEALADPVRRAEVETVAEALMVTAFARIEANRTARFDVLDVLGDAPEPLVGVPLRATHIDRSRDEAAVLVAGGADILRVEVPASRELADLLVGTSDAVLADAGIRIAREPRAADGPAPTGSQRALAAIRSIVDEGAAEGRAYAGVAVVPRALGGPELSVVASLERIDDVHADPLSEIVVAGVEPARALADHSFLRRLLRRAGCRVVVDAGALAVGPDLATGLPAPAVGRAGRALALQALSVELARADGLEDGDLLLGSLPPWLLAERSAGAIALAYVAAQRRLYPGIGFMLSEPEGPSPSRDRWCQLGTLALIVAGGAAVVSRDANEDSVAAVVDETRSSAETAARLAVDAGPIAFGPGLDAAGAAIAASAIETLEGLDRSGWGAILGSVAPPGSHLAAGTSAPRADAPDVFAMGIRATA